MSKLYIKLIGVVIITLILTPFNGISQSAEWFADNQKEIDSLRKGDFVIQVLDDNNNYIEAEVTYSLKKHEFPWSTAISSSDMQTDYWYAATARKFFNSAVTENAFKWSQMQPNSGSVNYTDVNHYLEWCESVGWDMRGHALLWGSKDYEDFHPLQQWVKDLPVPEMYNECKTRVQREMEYYKGRIKEYDVLNEALPGHANWLQKTVGDSINWNSFKWAHETDSNAKLYINDYNIITYKDYDNYVELIQTMLDNGAPVNGIGVQSHFGKDVSPSLMKARLDSVATLGLPIKITEFDMQVGENNISEANQAKYTSYAMRTAFAHEAVNGFVFWGFWDSRHWRDKAGIFTESKLPKIAADTVYDLIHTTWSSSGFQTVSSTLPLEVNGYFGEYELEVDYLGEKRVLDLLLGKAINGDTLTINFSAGELPAPEIVNAIAYDENSIVLYFDSKIITDGTELEQFKVISANDHSISSIWQPAHDSTQVVLELSEKINYRHYLTVSYFPGTIKDVNGSELEFFGVFEVDNRLPGFMSGTTNQSGEIVELVFSRDMAEPNATDIAAFEFTVDDISTPVTEIGIVESDAKKIYFNLETAVEFGQQVKVSYIPGDIQSVGEGILSSFGPKLITNMVPTSINSIFDKNNVKAFYSNQDNSIRLENLSSNNQDYFYSIFNLVGIKIYQGRINSGQKIMLKAAQIEKGLAIVRFESLNRKVSSATKLIIDK
ncbi:MAG: endo-1,4-beta-xylanase [Salinivirgaceae bacterium]|jgi:uncharacterized repeat protein (TIGR02059 family)|nr:endo-1,4-beta-xylanase [Salinivirgaceae bacterium]